MDFVKMLDDELEEFLKELICDRKTTEEGTRKAMWLDALREECENEIANRMATGIWGTARLKTGQYINIYTDRSSRNYDVLIILNEANDAPTDTEVDIIESEIRPILENDMIDTSEKRAMSEKALDDLELNCLEYGCELVFNY